MAAGGGGEAAAAAPDPDAIALLSATLDEDAAAARVGGAGRPWGTLDPRSAAYRLLSPVNEATKWAVSGLVFLVLVAAHNEWAAWAVVGAVLSSFLCKVLKRAINERRPASARKQDPGMPSSHANSLNFLSVYAALSLLHHGGGRPAAAALAALTVAAGLFLTWLRVALGFHTWPQVLAGGALGAATAAGWSAWGARAAVPALAGWPPGLPLLYGCTLVGMAAFAAKNVLAWRDERRGGSGAGGGAAGGGGKLRSSDAGGGGEGWRGAAPAAG